MVYDMNIKDIELKLFPTGVKYADNISFVIGNSTVKFFPHSTDMTPALYHFNSGRGHVRIKFKTQTGWYKI